MKKISLCLLLLGLLPAGARAGIILGTSNPSGTPLVMTAGTTSGPMFVNIVGNGSPNDMADWQFRIVIIKDASATGTVTFKDPSTGTTNPSNPTNYVFGNHGAGIVASNGVGGTQLDANDFDNNFGTMVGSSGFNLLQIDFLASSNASGLFGIYAVRGNAFTAWDDGTSSNNPQFFTNIPSGTGMVLIGDVNVQSTATPAPEPATLVLFGLGVTLIGGWQLRKKKGADKGAS